MLKDLSRLKKNADNMVRNKKNRHLTTGAYEKASDAKVFEAPEGAKDVLFQHLDTAVH